VPEHVERITDVVDRRIVEMHDWAKNLFYHPGMRGRTSIKIVMDALWRSDAELRGQFEEWTALVGDVNADPYSALPAVVIAGVPQEVHEGTGAMKAYQEMMYGAEKHDPATKAKWAEMLEQYCRLDTLSMVLIYEYWKRVTRQA
jgi:hypothetical protein